MDVLENLVLIQDKSSLSLTIPNQGCLVSGEEVDAILDTAKILQTGHTVYEASIFTRPSTLTQAQSALETYKNGAIVPLAVHYETPQTADILGNEIRLGPLVLFLDKTYIPQEELERVKYAIQTASPDDLIDVNIYPTKDCVVEARYINWLPGDEVTEMLKLPMFQESDNGLPPIDTAAALALLQSWFEDDEKEQRETWEVLSKALDEDRLSDRKLFS